MQIHNDARPFSGECLALAQPLTGYGRLPRASNAAREIVTQGAAKPSRSYLNALILSVDYVRVLMRIHSPCFSPAKLELSPDSANLQVAPARVTVCAAPDWRTLHAKSWSVSRVACNQKRQPAERHTPCSSMRSAWHAVASYTMHGTPSCMRHPPCRPAACRSRCISGAIV